MTRVAAVDPGNEALLERHRRRGQQVLLGLSAPALLTLMVVVFLPVFWLSSLSLLDRSGSLTAENYARIFQSELYLGTFVVTFQISVAVTLLCALLGYPLSYWMARLPPGRAAICMVFVLVPFWTSVLVRTYAWLVLLQRRGLINTWGIELGLWTDPLPLVHNLAGTLIGMVHIMLPFMVLPLFNSMRAIDGDCLKAAASLGASPARAFWTVFFPLSLPGLFAGALLVFVICLGFYVTPAVLGGGKVIMVSNQIANDIELFFNWGAASSLGVVLLVSTLLLLWLASRLMRLETLLGASR